MALSFSAMTPVILVVSVAAVLTLAVPPPAESAASPAESENPLVRTVPRDDCRPGLCPHIRRLVPDLSHAPPHHIHQGLARNEFVGEPSLCGNLCLHDTACASHQKCCPTTCGYACQDTVYIHEEGDEYQ